MAHLFMYIPNDDTKFIPSVDHNQWLKRFVTKLNTATNQNSIKVPKAFISTYQITG